MMFEEIREVISEELGIRKEEISLETTLEELGADSLDLFQIAIELEDKYDMHIEKVDGLKTIKDIVEYVEKTSKETAWRI